MFGAPPKSLINGISNHNISIFSFQHQWGYYKSFPGHANDTQASGAYIFRPEIPDGEFQSIQPSNFTVRESGLLTEIRFDFEVPWLKESMKIYKDKHYIDFDFEVGPIDISDGEGKEIVTRFDSNINNNGYFYTDSNGREFLQRKRSKRNTWRLKEFEPIAGNYYPVNAAIYIEDIQASMTILTDRSQGGTSLQDGSIELMVHRRTVKDDSRGVDEPLNETDVGITPYPNALRLGQGLKIKGKHRVLVNMGKCGAGLARDELDKMFSPLHVFAATSTSSNSNRKQYPISALKQPLPKNLQLVTTKLLSSDKGINTFLLRVGHAYAQGESEILSIPVALDLSTILTDHEIIHVQEKTLTGNRDRRDWLSSKMSWNEAKWSREVFEERNNNFTVLIHPMEIRTFQVKSIRK